MNARIGAFTWPDHITTVATEAKADLRFEDKRSFKQVFVVKARLSTNEQSVQSLPNPRSIYARLRRQTTSHQPLQLSRTQYSGPSCPPPPPLG